MNVKRHSILLLLAFNKAIATRCRRWLGKCTQHSDCCNNRCCMKWDRCSLLYPRPNQGPNKVYKCFDNNTELIAGVQSYREGNATEQTQVQGIYGNSIGTWCVDYVTNFTSVFDGLTSATGFNDDISRWNTS
jgi:hypothetical protein